jgi:hypothetical protein
MPSQHIRPHACAAMHTLRRASRRGLCMSVAGHKITYTAGVLCRATLELMMHKQERPCLVGCLVDAGTLEGCTKAEEMGFSTSRPL